MPGRKQVVLCEHELPGTARHDPLAYLQNRTVDWLDHQLAARELLDIDPAETYLVVEHEYPPARIQDKDELAPILEGSVAFTKAIDEAAAAMYALQNDVLASQGYPRAGRRAGSVPVMNLEGALPGDRQSTAPRPNPSTRSTRRRPADTAPKAWASIVGHMKQTPTPQNVAATSADTGESATLSRYSPIIASRLETHSRPVADRTFCTGPAKCLKTNMMMEM